MGLADAARHRDPWQGTRPAAIGDWTDDGLRHSARLRDGFDRWEALAAVTCPPEPVQILCEDRGRERGVGMARKRSTAEQIIGTLREAEVAWRRARA